MDLMCRGRFHLKQSLFVVLLYLIQNVDCRYCWHIFHGHTKYFYCGIHQSCCGTKCCDNIVAFYRLWYFWMCVLMLFVACSGGGFWLRRRRMGDDIRASLTRTTDERFVRNLGDSSRSRVRANQREHLFPGNNPEGAGYPVEPPPYSDVAESKPPSYESLFRDQGRAGPGGDNPSFLREDRSANGSDGKNQVHTVVTVS